ncbi:MAG: nuclear transport factor 2 family protein [Defluviitaleaceae bacterium]|nr:nuclear transport factor 2 family protein [Defluviitaleaceae bacterium]
MKNFKDALEKHLKAIAERDLPSFAEFLHPSHKCIIILPNGDIVEGNENILSFHKDWFSDPDWRMDVETIDTFSVENTGYALLDVVYHDVDQDGNPYEMTYFLGLIFLYVDDKWVLVRDQNTMK